MINKRWKFAYLMFIRYLIILVSSLGGLWIFYFVFTPITVYLVYFILGLFFNSVLYGNIIFIGEFNSPIEIVDACVAGAAYFLLLIFNLSVPNIKFSRTIKMIAFAFSSFLVINVLRIVILSIIFVLKPEFFDITHQLSWYIGSVVLVVGIWFVEVKKFKIKEIPFYSDIKSLLSHIR